jgi:predicted AAA+ superfamily ATPase
VDAETRDRLLFLNPWHELPACFDAEVARRLPSEVITREAAPLAPDRDKASLIVGPRQAGKSTWVWQQLRGAPPSEVLFVDCEEPLLRAWCRSAVGFVRDLERELPSVRTVFLEEAQHLEEAGLFVKGLVDARRGLRVYVTGSSSYHLAARTRESLAGRAHRRRILPLSLAEELGPLMGGPPAVQAARAEEVVRRQWVRGAFPAVVRSEDPTRELQELVEAFVLRDASDRFRVHRPDAFRKLIQFAAGQIGSMVNLAEWAATLGISAPTVGEYLAILEDAWIVRRLPAFSGGKRNEITSAQRIHFVDIGVRNAVLGQLSPNLDRRPDRGAIAEGWVYGELLKTLPEAWSIHYWRAKGGAEMDFVATYGERRIAVEVKAGRPAITRSARSFVDAYTPEALLIVSGESAPEERLGPTRILRTHFANVSATLRWVVANGGTP